MIIDAHVHLVGISPENGCFLSHRHTKRAFQTLQKGALKLVGTDREDFDRVARARLLRYVTESEVDYIGLLALDGAYDNAGRLDERKSTYVVSNDYLFQVARDSPKYLPVASINPQRRDAIEELERVAEAATVAIKTLPNTQNFDPALPRYIPFWRRMADLGIPLLAHTSFEYSLPEHDKSLGEPQRLRPALDEGVTVIAAHCGSGGVYHPAEHFHDWLRLLEEYPHLYGDISALASPLRSPFILKVLRHPIARERIILGSDYPVPVTSAVFAPVLGLRRALSLQRISNPIQRNLETFRALGVDRATEARAAKVFRMPGMEKSGEAARVRANEF